MKRPPASSMLADLAVEGLARRSSPTRRAFSRTIVRFLMVLAFLRLGLLRLFGRTAHASTAPDESPVKSRASWGMTIDLDRCTGCGACVVACRTENNVPTAGPEMLSWGTEISWMELLAVEGEATGERARFDMLPLPCMHCADAPCVKVCPTNATYITEDGIVAQIWDRCIGCRYCQVACPYSRRFFNWTTPEWPDSFRSFLNPDVAPRPNGVVEKCTLCHHRVRKVHLDARVEGREPGDEELRHLPACAAICPADAITFGDLSDPGSSVSRLARSPRSFRLLEHLGTNPKVVYLAKDRRVP